MQDTLIICWIIQDAANVSSWKQLGMHHYIINMLLFSNLSGLANMDSEFSINAVFPNIIDYLIKLFNAKYSNYLLNYEIHHYIINISLFSNLRGLDTWILAFLSARSFQRTLVISRFGISSLTALTNIVEQWFPSWEIVSSNSSIFLAKVD